MADLVQCFGKNCVREVSTSAGRMIAYCDDCSKMNGTYIKTWHELTLEEKVEDLNSRLQRMSMYIEPIG
jgi:hypothetical protein